MKEMKTQIRERQNQKHKEKPTKLKFTMIKGKDEGHS